MNSLLGRYFAAVIGFGFVAVWISVGITAAALCLFGSAVFSLGSAATSGFAVTQPVCARSDTTHAWATSSPPTTGRTTSSCSQQDVRRDPTKRGSAAAASACQSVDYINAHGTSTPLGDASETRVIKRATADLPAAGRRGSFDHHGLAPMSLSSEHTAPRCRSSDRRQYERL